jgi:transcriptional regulator with XRE-family HTH domain
VTPKERFAANLRQARNETGISQEELAERCALHRTEVSLLERAGREPRLGTIVKLAFSLGTSPEALLEGISWTHKSQRYDVKLPPRAK